MFTLVPSNFYNNDCAREYLAQVVDIPKGCEIHSDFMPEWDAWLVWTGEVVKDGHHLMWQVLRNLKDLPQYNKIICSMEQGRLYLAIAQGKSLLLANSFPAADFTTAQYYIFLSLKSLQLNPEISTICWCNELSASEEMSLYRYFKAVEILR